MKLLSFSAAFSAAALLVGAAQAQTSAASSFLPPKGQTYYYRYSETVTAPKTNVALTATLTLKTLSENDVQVTFAADGRAPRTLDFRVDETGALQPVLPDVPAKRPKTEEEIQQRAAAQTLLLRLALVSRVGANRESSFPIPLSVAWANGPVNPILNIKSMEPNTFVADADASTFVNPPSRGESAGTLIPLGLGVAGTFRGTATGRVVGIASLCVSAVSALRRPHGPQPADVKLHLAGELMDGRLQKLSGDQENVVRPGKHATTFSDRWILVAA
jgi:hypothetical protein